MTLTEWLERRAKAYWQNGENIPMDLFAEMNAAGMDVQALEDQHFNHS